MGMTANVFVVLAALISGPLTAMIIAWERDRSAVRMGRFVDKLTKWRPDQGHMLSTNPINRQKYQTTNPKKHQQKKHTNKKNHQNTTNNQNNQHQKRNKMDAF